jgi:hypothetical protein
MPSCVPFTARGLNARYNSFPDIAEARIDCGRQKEITYGIKADCTFRLTVINVNAEICAVPNISKYCHLIAKLKVCYNPAIYGFPENTTRRVIVNSFRMQKSR